MTKNAKQISFMLRKGLHLLAICASRLSEGVEACIPRMRRVTAIACFAAAAWGLIVEGNLSAATVPPGFTESVISGPWPDAVGITFENNGRMYVWERTGRLWFKDPSDHSPSLLLDISEEVGAWQDHGMLGFALDPNFRVNGYIYVLYVGGSLLSSPFRGPQLRPQCESIQHGDHRAADAVHVPVFRWLSVSGPGQPADFDWRNEADGNPNLLRDPWSWEFGVRGGWDIVGFVRRRGSVHTPLTWWRSAGSYASTGLGRWHYPA